MSRTQWLGATAALMIFAATGFSAGVHAQDAPKPDGEGGCTTVDGVSTGAGCSQATGSPDATTHQQELLKTGDKATGQDMDASGAGGSALPATEHQQEVLKKPDAPTDKGTTQP